MQRWRAEIPPFLSHSNRLRPHQGSILFTWKWTSESLKAKLFWGGEKHSTFIPSGMSTKFFRLSLLLLKCVQVQWVLFSEGMSAGHRSKVNRVRSNGPDLMLAKGAVLVFEGEFAAGGGSKAAKEALHLGRQSAKWLTCAVSPVPSQPQLCFKVVKTEILISHCGSCDNRHVEQKHLQNRH